MISDYTEYSLIEVSCLWWIECDDDPRGRVVLHGSLRLAERENIAFVSDELESCR